jgi:hypothetical protein
MKPVNTTVQNHLASRRLEERPAQDDEVLGFWRKALQAYGDARNASSSLESRFLRAYDAGRIAALAIVRAAGYRTRGAESHHYVTLDVARSLVSDPELAAALNELNVIRNLRHAVEYEYEDDLDANAVASAVRAAEKVISLGAKHLWVTRPTLGKRIKMAGPEPQ